MVPMCAGITLTSDPEGRAAMGGSSGGCAAFTMAWCRPDLFRRVLTYSGKYAPCSVQSIGLDREAISQNECFTLLRGRIPKSAHSVVAITLTSLTR